MAGWGLQCHPDLTEETLQQIKQFPDMWEILQIQLMQIQTKMTEAHCKSVAQYRAHTWSVYGKYNKCYLNNNLLINFYRY